MIIGNMCKEQILQMGLNYKFKIQKLKITTNNMKHGIPLYRVYHYTWYTIIHGIP